MTQGTNRQDSSNSSRAERQYAEEEYDQIGSDRSDLDASPPSAKGASKDRGAYKVRADARLPGSGRGRMSVVERANPNIYRPGNNDAASTGTPVGQKADQDRQHGQRRGQSAERERGRSGQSTPQHQQGPGGMPVVRRFHTPGSIPGTAPIRSANGPKTVFGHRM